jgi:hypothetical protein
LSQAAQLIYLRAAWREWSLLFYQLNQALIQVGWIETPGL